MLHRVKDCASSVRCKHDGCGRKHHTMLHETQQQPEDESKAVYHSSQTYGQSRVATYFQLVEVFASGSNGRTIRTVAILDSGSQVTLLHELQAQELGLKGEKRALVVKTMASEVTKDSRLVSLKIKSQDPSLSDTVHIHRAWTVDGDTFKCPSQRLCDSWQHRKYLGIPEYIDPSEVKMLVGIDHPSARDPLRGRTPTTSSEYKTWMDGHGCGT